jgi:hypothetical protein
MDDRIKEHLKRLNKYYLRLSDARRLEKEIFIQEDLYQASSERYLQMAINNWQRTTGVSPWVNAKAKIG